MDTFRRCANVLALAATLALALVPGLGRLWSAQAGHPVRGMHAAHHAIAKAAERPAGDQAGHAGKVDCAYCPLLAATALAGEWTYRLGTHAPQGDVASRHAPRPSAAGLHGLGARGPPRAA